MRSRFMEKELAALRPIRDPEIDELADRIAGMFEPVGMTVQSYATRDGPRNFRLARIINRIPGWHLQLSGREHGPDGYIWYPAGLGGSEVEIKTAIEKRPDLNMYEKNKETPDRLEMYSRDAFLFGVFRQNGIDQPLAAWFLPPDSRMNAYFCRRLEALERGEPQISRKFSLKQFIEWEAARVF